MTMTIREAFEKGMEAFNAHDAAAFAGLLADDIVLRAPGGVSSKGKETAAQYFAGWLTAFPDAHVEIHALHITGDVVVDEGTFTGTHRGVLRTPAGDIQPTGRRVTADYIEVLHIRDGMTTSFNLMFDQLEMLEQLGLVPASATAG